MQSEAMLHASMAERAERRSATAAAGGLWLDEGADRGRGGEGGVAMIGMRSSRWALVDTCLAAALMHCSGRQTVADVVAARSKTIGAGICKVPAVERLPKMLAPFSTRILALTCRQGVRSPPPDHLHNADSLGIAADTARPSLRQVGRCAQEDPT